MEVTGSTFSILMGGTLRTLNSKNERPQELAGFQVGNVFFFHGPLLEQIRDIDVSTSSTANTHSEVDIWGLLFRSTALDTGEV